MVACVVGNTHFAPPPCLVKWWPLGIFLIFIIIVVIVKLIITIPTKVFSPQNTLNNYELHDFPGRWTQAVTSFFEAFSRSGREIVVFYFTQGYPGVSIPLYV